MSLKRAFMKHINIFTFLICFLLVDGFHWLNWIINKYHGIPRFEQAFIDQTTCNAQSGGRNDCQLSDRYSLATLYFYTGMTCGSGFFLFISWGISSQYPSHWKRILKALARGDFKSIASMGLTTMDHSSSNSGFSITKRQSSTLTQTKVTRT